MADEKDGVVVRTAAGRHAVARTDACTTTGAGFAGAANVRGGHMPFLLWLFFPILLDSIRKSCIFLLASSVAHSCIGTSLHT